MRPSDMFFSLMRAAQARGLEQCKGNYFMGEGGPIDHGSGARVTSVCAMGLVLWGRDMGVLTVDEVDELELAMPAQTTHLNDTGGWTFADFYEYLKSREAGEDSDDETLAERRHRANTFVARNSFQKVPLHPALVNHVVENPFEIKKTVDSEAIPA